jgi:uncharacterized protein YjbI with pentapeptide repeats
MADRNLVQMLRNAGVEAWNRSRVDHPDYPRCDIYEEAVRGADLSGAELSGVDLGSAIMIGADLRGADLRGADLSKSWLHQADLTGANLEGARLDEALLLDSKLRDANLRGASLRQARIEGDKRLSYPSHIVVGANLTGANLTSADLTGAQILDSSLAGVNLTDANIEGSTIVNAHVHGVSIWDLRGKPARQSQLIIRVRGGRLEFNDLRAAVFFNLLQNGLSLGDVVSISGKVSVLILGRFTDDNKNDTDDKKTVNRKLVLEGLRGKLESLGFNPVVFDFERPEDRDLTEMIISLAAMSLFILADLTKPRSVPLELQATVPNLMIPFVPIIQRGEEPFAMFKDLLGKHDWVLDVLEYDQLERLLAAFKEAVVVPALNKRDELRSRKADVRPKRSIDDYLR